MKNWKNQDPIEPQVRDFKSIIYKFFIFVFWKFQTSRILFILSPDGFNDCCFDFFVVDLEKLRRRTGEEGEMAKKERRIEANE